MFIVLEGVDGCGKTTQCSLVYDWLVSELGEGSAIRTLEPGGWDGGEAVRALVLNNEFIAPWSEFFLFMADRCEHVERVVRPALSDGRILLCDRYTPSTLAYQFYGDNRYSADTASFVIDSLLPRLALPVPDIVFWLDIDTEDARNRLVSRGKRDLFDLRERSYFDRVAYGYREIMNRPGTAKRLVRVDASLDEQSVFEQIRAVLKPCVESFSPK